MQHPLHVPIHTHTHTHTLAAFAVLFCMFTVYNINESHFHICGHFQVWCMSFNATSIGCFYSWNQLLSAINAVCAIRTYCENRWLKPLEKSVKTLDVRLWNLTINTKHLRRPINFNICRNLGEKKMYRNLNLKRQPRSLYKMELFFNEIF